MSDYCTGCAQLLTKLKQAEATVERLTWMLNDAAEGLLEHYRSGTSESTSADVIAELERRWAERGTK